MRTRGKSQGKNPLADLANAATRVVHTAAEILEEEMAAGIKAAQEVSAQMESALGNGADSTHEGFLEVVDRFEHDAKEAVSVLANLFRILARASEKIEANKAGEDAKSD